MNGHVHYKLVLLRFLVKHALLGVVRAKISELADVLLVQNLGVVHKTLTSQLLRKFLWLSDPIDEHLDPLNFVLERRVSLAGVNLLLFLFHKTGSLWRLILGLSFRVVFVHV